MVTIDDVQSPHSVELAEDTSGASEGPSREKAPEELSSVEKARTLPGHLAACGQDDAHLYHMCVQMLQYIDVYSIYT